MKKQIKGISQKLSSRLQIRAKQLIDQRCVICQQACLTPVCESCQKAITKPSHTCRVCGKALVSETAGNRCKTCIETPPTFAFVEFVGTYENTLADLIIRAKLGKDIQAIDALQRIVTDYFQRISVQPDSYLLAMPTPTSRLMHRGFNLPAMIAKAIAKEKRLPMLNASTVRQPFYVRKQAKLSLKQRQKNRHFYQINGKLPEKIIIVDDIFTTGQTAHELAKILRKKGAKNIGVYVIARGQMI